MRVANRFRRGPWPWAVFAAVAIGNLFLHVPISSACDALYARIGRGPYERLTLLGIGALSIGAALLLLRGRAAALRRPRVAAALVLLAAATVAVQRWLLVSNIELIHFPQFGLLAALLFAAGLGPQAAWIGATFSGVLDETYQHLVVYAQVPGTYFDYNDIVLNALGAAWAVAMLAGGGAGETRRDAGRWLVVLRATLLVALAAALWLAPPRLAAIDRFPYWCPALARAATGLDYHVMNASEGLAALLLIWGLVAVATRGPRRRTGAAVLPRATAAVLLALVLDAGARAAGHASPPATASPSAPFITTFWCGPPPGELTDARAAEIAAAGFTVVGAPCEGIITPDLNLRALDVAARHGLTLWITDGRVSLADDLPTDWAARLGEAVAAYGDHPALGGYFVVDEPNAARFTDLARIVARLRAADPRRLAYVNLLPDFASSDALGTATYREHVEQFVATVQPPLLSFDYYPFKDDADRDTFFANLGLMRAVARAHGVPFLLIVQAMPHGPYRDPTEAELAWQVNHALAFGARGISYFAYWTPVHVEGADTWQFRHGLVENGRPTEHFYQAARLNRGARSLAEQLSGLQSIGVVDSAGRFGTPLPVGPLAGIDGGPVTAGFFAGDDTLAVMLVNQDYRSTRRIALRLRDGAAAPEAFDVATGGWQRLREPVLALAPGGARLLRWR
jgi:hypothetical protein